MTTDHFSVKIVYVVEEAQIAQLVEQRTENPRVAGSIPALGICPVQIQGLSFILREWLRGGAPPCQGGGRGFESRLALFLLAGISLTFKGFRPFVCPEKL